MTDKKWWKSGVVYQIWPASYKDSNGDGYGDIPGIISKLDYLKDVGVDIIWLSPMYKSPQYDMGYDISDYQDVWEKYGTMKDMDNLIKGCHDRKIKLILDLVVNHTSHLHKWFEESRSSKDNPKRDWYIWKPAKYDENGKRHPPNNWASIFSGSAWEWDEKTQEYYLHLFATEQPDLNWENPETRKAIYSDAALFWLDKGVDGFRIDTVNLYSKVTSYPDAPVVDPKSEFQPAGQFYVNGPRIHEFIHEMHENTFAKYDCMTVGECGGTHNPEEVNKFVGAHRKELDMVFQFDTVELGQDPKLGRYVADPFDLSDFKDATERIQKVMEGTDGWNASFIENHDQARAISRFLSDAPEHRVQSSRLIASLIGTLSGTLFIYQGQEIGTTNIPKTWGIEEYKDVEAVNYWNEIKTRTNDDAKVLSNLLVQMQKESRDNARLPVQWDDSPEAGFTTGKPWIRVHDDYKEINVKKDSQDPNGASVYWKKVIKLRKKYEDLFVYGKFDILDRKNKDVFTYKKEFNGKQALVVLNFSGSTQKFTKPTEIKGNLSLELGSIDKPKESELEPYESRIYLVQ